MNCKNLKKLLADPHTYIVPGVYDGISAKLVEKVGFKVMSITGNGLGASALGLPDVGLMSMREVVDYSRNISNAVNIPVIADADTGYGAALNVIRTVREFEQAGLSGIHLEDQISPKKCAYYEGKKELVSIEHQVHKLKAAIATRKNTDFCIIARTDALLVYGFEEMLLRTRKYVEVGIDGVFVVGFSDIAQIAAFKREFRDVPLIVNLNDTNPLNKVGFKCFEELGVKLILYPATARSAAAKAVLDTLSCLHADGNTQKVLDELLPLDEFSSLMGAGDYQELEKKYVRD